MKYSIYFIFLFLLVSLDILGLLADERVEPQKKISFLKRGKEGASEVFQYKGEKRGRLNFDELAENSEEWLSFSYFTFSLKQKEEDKYWRLRAIEKGRKEVMGRVISCYGQCKHFRGTGFSFASFNTILLEGDEFETIEDSYAWIYLYDGTLIRVSPKTSLTLLEIDVGVTKNLIVTRLNKGFIHLRNRRADLIPESDLPETDPLFLPLKWYPANSLGRGFETILPEELFLSFLAKPSEHNNKIKQLNKLIKYNNFHFQTPTKTLFITPQGSLYGSNMEANIFVIEGEQAAFQVNTPKGEFLFRGHTNRERREMDVGKWYYANHEGTILEPLEDGDRIFGLTNLLVRRPITQLMAREFMALIFSLPLFEERIDAKNLSEIYGFRLWEDKANEDWIKKTILFKKRRSLTDKQKEIIKQKSDLDLRIDFLIEYSRRMETTNLISAKNLQKRVDQLVGDKGIEKDRDKSGDDLSEIKEANSKEAKSMVATTYESDYFALAFDSYMRSLNKRLILQLEGKFEKDTIWDFISTRKKASLQFLDGSFEEESIKKISEDLSTEEVIDKTIKEKSSEEIDITKNPNEKKREKWEK